MAMILNVGKRELDRFTRPPLKPGDAIVKRPGYGLVRIQYPLTEREDCAAIATIMHRISEYSCEKSAKLALLPASEGEQTATALAVRDEGDNSFRKDIQTGLNVSTSGSDRALPALYDDLKIQVSSEAWQAIVREGNRQLQESERVRPTYNQKALGWNPYRYQRKIMPVCAALRWNNGMHLDRLPPGEWRPSRRSTITAAWIVTGASRRSSLSLTVSCHASRVGATPLITSFQDAVIVMPASKRKMM